MNLSIIHTPKLERPYLLKREHGEYKQHAHFHTREMAEKCRRLIDNNKYPYSKELKIAVQRILTEEEFKKLNKKERYYNVNKGRIK
ncbi:hypothetical protein [Miniphocaeibacter massiliensis]|uniref:hypothetical protein n=1 Tax=Miniphocaeibacter massiliensis TaxID=2041841 RepID=UPI000C1BF5EA|nr:hypothetical protein [Miniphocaeibacter massiliensis]